MRVNSTFLYQNNQKTGKLAHFCTKKANKARLFFEILNFFISLFVVSDIALFTV